MLIMEEVAAAFEHWRVMRTRRNEPVPEHLWEMAQALIPHYKLRHIQKVLKLTTGQFNKYLKPYANKNSIESTMNEFAVGAFVPEQRFNDEPCELTLQGANKSLLIKINLRNISPVLSLMERYL